MKWDKKWTVHSHTDYNKTYVVSLDEDGETWGCSCPHWTHRRVECKHIQEIKYNYEAGELDENGIDYPKPEYILANVRKPELKRRDGKIVLYIPLLRLPDKINMEACICNAMLLNGYTMTEVKERRNVQKWMDKNWTAKNILLWGEENNWEGIEYPADPVVVKKKKKAS